MGERFRFLHCADLHIGSGFTGLSRRIPELDGELSRTPFLAWRNTVAVALREKVDFLLIAGDCFDRSAPSLQGRLEFVKGLKTLCGAGIPVFIVSGNHDPWPQAWSAAVALPENVTFFPPGEVKLHQFCKNGSVAATIGGIGHDSLNVLDNLAVRTGEALKEAPGLRIALVHANLCGDPHAAPATLAELTALPVDYWALGHVHSRRVLHEKPFVVYSGCVQGRDIHEPGTQGCYVVDCDGFGGLSLTFHPTSVLEFRVLEVDAGASENLEQLLELLLAELKKLDLHDRLLFRLKLTGVTSLDAELRKADPEELRTFFYEGVRNAFEGVFLEEIVLLTRMPVSDESAVLPADELARAAAEIAEEGVLEKLYDEMRRAHRELPPIRPERFAELRSEGSALLAELLAGKLGLKR